MNIYNYDVLTKIRFFINQVTRIIRYSFFILSTFFLHHFHSKLFTKPIYKHFFSRNILYQIYKINVRRQKDIFDATFYITAQRPERMSN